MITCCIDGDSGSMRNEMLHRLIRLEAFKFHTFNCGYISYWNRRIKSLCLILKSEIFTRESISINLLCLTIAIKLWDLFISLNVSFKLYWIICYTLMRRQQLIRIKNYNLKLPVLEICLAICPISESNRSDSIDESGPNTSNSLGVGLNTDASQDDEGQ